MKKISIIELRKNIYRATNELPVEIMAKGKTLFYIVKDIGGQVSARTEKKVEEIKEVSTVESVGEILKRQKKLPLFCPKHNSMRIGEKYSCGCEV